MNSFAISWRLRKSLAGAVILTIVSLTLLQMIPDTPVNVLCGYYLVHTVLLMGLVLLCCNFGAVPGKKAIVTWIVVGVTSMSLLGRIYIYYILDTYYGGYDTYMTILSVLHVFMVALFVLMIVFSEGMMRLYFGLLTLIYALVTIINLFNITSEFSLWIIQGTNVCIDSCLCPLLLFGAVVPDRQECMVRLDDGDTAKGVGAWGIVFMCALLVLLVVTGLNINNLRGNYYDSYSWAASRVTEGYYTRLVALMFVPALISLTFMMLFANIKDGYKVNGVLAAVFGGLASTVSFIGVGIDYFDEYGIMAAILISVFSAVVAICSLITLMASKDAAKGGLQKYMAFSAISSIMMVICCILYFGYMDDTPKYCCMIMMGLSMYVPTALRYISPKIKAPVIAAVFGLLLVMNLLLIACNSPA